MRTMAINQIRYREAGEKGGLPVVFIHAFPLSKDMWAPQLSALAKGRRLVSYDLRGHGPADPGDGLYTMDLYAAELFELMDTLGIERAVLVGLSMGGYVALRAASMKPARLRGLVLADTRAEPDTNQAKAMRAAAMASIAEKGMGPFADEFVKNLFSPAALAAGRPCVEEAKRIMKANKPLGVRGALLALAARMDAAPWLPEIKVPTLVVVGEDDALTPRANSETIAKAVPGARLAVIPRAGHLSNLENPDAFNQALDEFLSSFKS